ncbi:hypothetical protein RMCBS344292_11634 [Rhizopus microsporus]|nr:hypothetical protein RMCBS344292_11634 [Rhizopus microsporus]
MEQKHAHEAVHKFLESGVIERSPSQDDRFLSNLCTIQEKDKIRPILDCKRINAFIQCQHFKMEGVSALREIIETDDYITKIDLKDAYTVVTISVESRQYLSFKHEGVIYQYKSLPFGVSVVPRIFSKLMGFALEHLRKQGIRLVYYLDDVCLLAKTKEEMETNVKIVISHLQHLGFIINYKKSKLQPAHCQEFLGFLFNTKTMRIAAPKKKLEAIYIRIKQVLKTTKTCRWIAALLGKMTALLPAVGEALIHMRFIQRDLARNLMGKQAR